VNKLCTYALISLFLAFGSNPDAVCAPAAKTAGDAKVQRSLELNEQGVAALKTKNGQLAESLFRQSVDADRYNLTAVFNLAGMLITNKKEQEAISLLTSYTERNSQDAGLYARLGDAYFSTQNPKKAITAYEKALSIEPKYRGISARLGTLYVLENKPEKAATMFEKAVALNPRDAQSLANLGSIYLALEKPKDAASMSKKALAIEQKPETYVTLGAAYQKLKDQPQALTAFKQALKLGSKDPELPKIIQELEGEAPTQSS